MSEAVANGSFEFSPDDQIYLEIGYGLDPSAIRGSRTFSDGSVYVGIDAAVGDYLTSPGRLYGEAVSDETSAFREAVKRQRPGEDIRFSIGDATSLPFLDDSVKEIYMANVLNAPITSETREAMLKECHRTLRPLGKLITKVSWDHFLYPAEEVERKLWEAGLVVWGNISADEDPEKFAELEAVFGTSTGIEARVGYFIVAEKPSL